MKSIITSNSHELQIKEIGRLDTKMVFQVSKTTEVEFCPHCGSPSNKTHGRVKPRKVYDKPNSFFKVELVIIRRR